MIKKSVFNIPFILVLIITISSCEKNDNNQLKEYVHKKDSAFKYEIVETFSADTWKEYKIKMVSGTWLTEKEVNHTEWWHWITIIVPNNVLETEALLIIGGGSSKDRKPKKASELLINAALETKSIVAEISNIPFQPLNYTNDSKDDRYEDDLIAYGWRKFLEGGAKNNDVTWLARLPMTRAVVKGMDVIQKVASDINIKIQNSFFISLNCVIH